MRVLVLTAALLTAIPTLGERNLVEGIVVRVNDRILTTRDMHRRMVERAAEMGREVQPSEYGRLVAETADELCLMERAAELKMDVTKDEVNTAIEQLKEDNRIADDAAYRAMLESTGITDQQLRSRMRDTILVRRVMSRELGSLPLTEEEVRQRYEREKDSFMIPERLHLQHIVLALAADRRDAAAKQARLERLAAAVRSGNDFLTLVEREVSEGGAIGGDLGDVHVSDLRDEVRQAAEHLAEGQVTEPFESAVGMHLIYLVKRIPATHKPFEEVSQELRERELMDRYNTRLSGVVANLKTRYVVETHPEHLTAP